MKIIKDKVGVIMVKTKNGFIDLGNGLFINEDLVKDYGIENIRLNNGETYRYGEFPKIEGYAYREECYDSYKGDFEYFKKRGVR